MSLGLITASFGRSYIVEVGDKLYSGVSKAKKSDYVVGDRVEVNISNDEQVQIIQLLPRKTLVFRSNNFRSKLIASNVTQLLIVIAVLPSFNINFLNACLVFAHWANIKPIIIINKADLDISDDFITNINQLYKQQLDYTIYNLSALDNCNTLLPILQNETSLLIGQSGVGKSTITNNLIVDANSRIGEISKSTTSGCHTTTNARLYHLNKHSDLIDCPGLQDFGLAHLDVHRLVDYFPEIASLAGECRFRDCNHQGEPDCIITKAYALGNITPLRYKYFISLSRELIQAKNIYN